MHAFWKFLIIIIRILTWVVHFRNCDKSLGLFYDWMWKNGKIFENLGKTIQNWKYEKGQVIVCDYCTQYTARKGPGRYLFAGLLP